MNKFTNLMTPDPNLQRTPGQAILQSPMPPAPSPPPCLGLGPRCRRLKVVLRVSNDLDTPMEGDHEATWLLGHTERITFGRIWRHREDLFADATLHVPCKHLREDGGRAVCRAHGFIGQVPRDSGRRQRRRLGGDRFEIVERGKLVARTLPAPRQTPRALAVLSHNPCADAPCQTSDHKRGAACCRDLQIEIMCHRSWTTQELLVRSRQSPYLCKVTRSSDEAIEAEMISACSYLGDDGVACSLHGRRRPDGRKAKPDLCHRWPHPSEEETLHPGCVFAEPKAARSGPGV